MTFYDDDPQVGEVVKTADQIATRVRELGAQITADYVGRQPVLVCVLKGAFVFVTDLARAIDLPVEVDFIAVSSYGNAKTTSGVVRLVKDLDADIEGRDVILVEDIVDSGLTLRYLRRNLNVRNPATLEVVSLLARDSADLTALDIKYVGFTIPHDDWLVGYGLDSAQRYRNLGLLARSTR